MSFRAYIIEKMGGLVGVYLLLYSNRPNNLKIFQTDWTFLDPNLDEVYDITTSDLKLTLLTVFSQKMADLKRP